VTWKRVGLARILREVDIRDTKNETILSVYREYGVVPKGSREDNFNKTPVDTSLYKLVCQDDIVINKMKAWQGSLGRSEYRGIVSGDYLVCRVTAPEVLPRFLHFLLRSQPLIDEYGKRSSGIRPSQWRLYWEDLREIAIVLPPVPRQLAIADFLDNETARIDELMTRKRRLAALLRSRFLAEVRHRMGGLSRQYGDIALKRLVTCLDGKRIPLSSEERSYRSGPFPYFGASGRIDSVDEYIFDETVVLLGEDGAQLADPDYEISFVVSGRAWVNNHAHVLRPTASDPWFLSFHLSTVDRILIISGATREKITQADMNEIPVPNVPITAQRRVSAELRHSQSLMSACTQSLGRQIALLQEHRQALITAAVTGEIEIPGAAA